ncbi:class I SAM-dependent methyltransferase [Ferrovibrio sp.]|uniref:class I SAM-dependent methyltransferase n=1 Tax=Ferrovibrio sp. TaxID=1917215 RepID=UPI00311FEF92
MIELGQQAEFVRANLAILGDWFGQPDLGKYADMLAARLDLKDGIESQVAPVDFFRTKSWDGVLRFGLYRAAQYALTRATGSQVSIETGVLHGLSSAFLLQGLADNGSGRLFSVDYPSVFEDGPSNRDGFMDTLPPRMGSGWAVPPALRSRWDLRLGKSSDLLPQILAENGRVDLFVHDSEHTWDTMTMEFAAIWPALTEGGVLIADNIDCNTSFFDFARKVGRIPYVAPVDPDHVVPGTSGIRFGVLKK